MIKKTPYSLSFLSYLVSVIKRSITHHLVILLLLDLIDLSLAHTTKRQEVSLWLPSKVQRHIILLLPWCHLKEVNRTSQVLEHPHQISSLTIVQQHHRHQRGWNTHTQDTDHLHKGQEGRREQICLLLLMMKLWIKYKLTYAKSIYTGIICIY